MIDTARAVREDGLSGGKGSKAKRKRKGGGVMREVTLDELMALPAGTIYSYADGKKYSDGIERKGVTEGDGWWHLELLPQATLGRDLPWFQTPHWSCREHVSWVIAEYQQAIFVYEQADLDRLRASISPHPPYGTACRFCGVDGSTGWPRLWRYERPITDAPKAATGDEWICDECRDKRERKEL